MTRWHLLLGAEVAASTFGFLAVTRLAGRLGREGFGSLEFALALVAWWLILVRGGFDAVITREAARRPTRIKRLSSILTLGRLCAVIVAWLAVGLIGRSETALICGFILVASALTPDLGARARGDALRIALGQLTRGLILFFVSLQAVDPHGAAMAFVAAESSVAVVHFATGGRVRWPRTRSGYIPTLRLTLGWMKRSFAATSSRFARVSLYAGDIVILGLLCSHGIGPYAAARRILFAILAIVIVLPSSALGPLSTAWVSGRGSGLVTTLRYRLLLLTLPATAGLLFTADGWMTTLFGEPFREGGRLLAILALRLPLMSGNVLCQTILTAAGMDSTVACWSWRQLIASSVLGSLAATAWGPIGLAWSFLLVEGLSLVAGVLLVRAAIITNEGPTTLSPAPGAYGITTILIGLGGLAAGCLLVSEWSVMIRSATGFIGFCTTFGAARLFRRARMPDGLRRDSGRALIRRPKFVRFSGREAEV